MKGLRARKGSSEARLKVFSFRVNDEEEALIVKASKGFGSYQEYLRDVVVSHATEVTR